MTIQVIPMNSSNTTLSIEEMLKQWADAVYTTATPNDPTTATSCDVPDMLKSLAESTRILEQIQREREETHQRVFRYVEFLNSLAEQYPDIPKTDDINALVEQGIQWGFLEGYKLPYVMNTLGNTTGNTFTVDSLSIPEEKPLQWYRSFAGKRIPNIESMKITFNLNEEEEK